MGPREPLAERRVRLGDGDQAPDRACRQGGEVGPHVVVMEPEHADPQGPHGPSMEAEGGGDVNRRRWSAVLTFICLTLLVSG